jgi:hypothetical protein
LATPWEYLVTIDQSALWQTHINWAKSNGKDLKAYVSSQYSSRMVLLSLLLATETSVFFSASPTLSDLRQTLNIWDEQNDTAAKKGILPFWIGFFLLLNICVTISGILATFSTWNVVAAISDANAHCLLRSSLGQYTTTLSPRLVVASLYLFFWWFLLFVVQLIFGGYDNHSTNGKSLFRELLGKHWHLVLLWALFLVAVTMLFFSIVVPLSAFGRLVLHTGAMAEQPVLSESLQVELLPRGLHAGLVIAAHHSRRKGTAVTLQYSRQQPWQAGSKEAEDQEQHHSGSLREDNHEILQHFSFSPLASRVTIDGSREEDTGSRNGDETTSSEVLTRFVSADSSSNGDGGNHGNCNTMLSSREDFTNPDTFDNDHMHEPRKGFRRTMSRTATQSRHRHHRRTPTTETTASLKFPPAAILNLSMTGQEFRGVIDSAIDTNSLCAQSPISTTGVQGAAMESERNEQEHSCDTEIKSFSNQNQYDSTSSVFFESTQENPGRSDGGKEGGCNRIRKDGDIRKQRIESIFPASRERHNSARIDKHSSRIPQSPCSMTVAIAQAASGTLDANSDAICRGSRNHRDLVTKHHRRVSSSRFLLEEWAQENRVRDLYGAAPPADLPHEIAWMLENERHPANAKGILPQRSPTTADGNASSNEFAAPPASTHSQSSQQHWWLSPFSSPFVTFGNRKPASRNTGRSSHRSIRGRGDENTVNSTSTYQQETLEEPLLPHLRANQDEELGEGSSELLGERLLRS